MTVMSRELHEALKAANVPEEKAAKAAEAVAYAAEAPRRLERLGTDVQEIKVRVTLLTWMVAFNLAATMAVLWKLLKV